MDSLNDGREDTGLNCGDEFFVTNEEAAMGEAWARDNMAPGASPQPDDEECHTPQPQDADLLLDESTALMFEV